jgi:hypothetical protein
VKRTGLFLTFALLALLAPAAAADKPLKEPLPPLEDAVYPAGLICPFPLLEEVLVNRGKSITFSDGSQLVTGTLKERLTNLDTGESIVVNISGPGTFTVEGDVLHVFGRGAWLLLAVEGEPGGPGALLIHGHIRFDVDLLTNLPSNLQVRGTMRDLCETLG